MQCFGFWADDVERLEGLSCGRVQSRGACPSDHLWHIHGDTCELFCFDVQSFRTSAQKLFFASRHWFSLACVTKSNFSKQGLLHNVLCHAK